MNREETKKAIKVMQAYVDGAEIEYQFNTADTSWATAQPSWNWADRTYRVKPKPREFLVSLEGRRHLYELPLEISPEDRKDFLHVREVLEDE